MADTQIKYISLDNLSIYHQLSVAYIDQKIAPTLKTVALSSDGRKLLFYTQEQPVGESRPAFEIEIPLQDLSGLIPKVVNAITGNIAVFDTGGSIKDSGISIDDIADKEYVDTKVKEEVSKTSHLTKEIVTSLPSDTDAKENIIYLIKDDTVTGLDKYEEWTLIGGTLVCIGTTSTDLTGYYTKEQVNAKISEAKQQAIDDAVATAAADATSKMNNAVLKANQYTDSVVGEVNKKVAANTESITNLAGDITTINNTLTSHGDRITALENGIPELATASNAEIYNLFGLTPPTN